jgi:hypothetical protein
LERLELLATAHAVVERSSDATEREIIEQFLRWSKEKAERYEPKDVMSALDELSSDGLIKRTLFGIQAISHPHLLEREQEPVSAA